MAHVLTLLEVSANFTLALLFAARARGVDPGALIISLADGFAALLKSLAAQPSAKMPLYASLAALHVSLTGLAVWHFAAR